MGEENSLQVIVQTTSKLPAKGGRRSVTPVIEHKRDFGTAHKASIKKVIWEVRMSVTHVGSKAIGNKGQIPRVNKQQK